MDTFIDWIDEKLETISQTALFKKYFFNVPLENIEDTYFLTNEVKGIDLTFTEDLTVKSLHFSFEMYKDNLPLNLKFNFNRRQITGLFGIANVSGGGFEDMYGYVNIWDKYYYKNFSLHIQYSKDKGHVELITLGTLRFEEDITPE